MIYQRLLKLSNLIIACLLFSSLGVQAQRKYYNKNENKNLKELQVEEDGYHFYVIGDWGRNGHFKQAVQSLTGRNVCQKARHDAARFGTGERLYIATGPTPPPPRERRRKSDDIVKSDTTEKKHG